MSQTKIKVSEAILSNSATEAITSGEIAIMLETTRGNPDKVYRLTDIPSLERIFGSGEGGKKAFKYAKWLISRGHCIQAVRIGHGGTKATVDLITGTGASPFRLIATAVAGGTAYNTINIVVGDLFDTPVLFSLKIYDGSPDNGGVLLETFDVVSLDEESPYYFDRVVNSDIISLSTTGTLGETVVTEGTKVMTGGTNGEVDGWATAATLLSQDECYFSILLIPDGFGSDSVAKALPVIMAKEMITFLPEVLSPNAAVYTKTAFDAELLRVKTALIDASGIDYSEYAGTLFPFVKCSGISGNVPASVVCADLLATIHEKSAWYLPVAGIPEGLVKYAISLGIDLTSSEISDLQAESVNPIVKKTGYGSVIWGDSTLNASASRIRDLHVRVLTNYLKRRAFEVSQKYMFALHNETTWNLWKADFEPSIRDIANFGGIEYYSVIMDRSIMTESDITKGILRGKISFKPVHCITDIEIAFTVDESGVSFE